MKLFILIALIGMASAEEVQPVELPEAPVPAYEDGPAVFEPVDIVYLMAPQEVTDEKIQNIDDISADVPVDPVQFVDNSDDSFADAPVNFVDNSDDVPYEAPVDNVVIYEFPYDAPSPVEEIAAGELESIRVVDLPVEFQGEEVKDTVQVVDLPLSDDVPVRYPAKVYPDPTWR